MATNFFYFVLILKGPHSRSDKTQPASGRTKRNSQHDVVYCT